jgi:collagenase-like PrtC family protease
MPIKEHVPMLVVGNIKFMKHKKMQMEMLFLFKIENSKQCCSKSSHDDTINPVLVQRNDEEMFAAEEDEHGTYFMNSKDLRAVQHVDLTQMGVASLKIEGRTKSYFYCARTAQIYRKAIDDALSGKPFDQSLMTQLEGLANRGYTEGFYVAILIVNIKIMKMVHHILTFNNSAVKY